MSKNELVKEVTALLEEKKAEAIVVLDVHQLTTITDYMVIATGSSTTHLRALSNFLQEELKKRSVEVLAVEGLEYAEWVLLDLGNIIVHLMLAETRAYYELEKLWSVGVPSA